MKRSLSVVVALAMTLTLLVAAPAATAQSTPTLTVTPDSIERPAAGNKPATLNFTVTGCDDCTVELDPGWLLPAADQAVKGKSDDFGAANYWNTGVIYGNKRGKGPVPETLGIKVRPGDGTRRFIRFTLNDSNSFVVAEAKVWLTPIPAPRQPEPQQPEPQQPDQEPQQNQAPEPEYELALGPEGERVDCLIRMTGGVGVGDAYELEEVSHDTWRRRYQGGGQWTPWVIERGSTTTRPLRPGEEFRLESSVYASKADVKWRWHLVNVVNNAGDEITVSGLPNNVQYLSGSARAPSETFTINYRIQQTGDNGATGTCSVKIRVR